MFVWIDAVIITQFVSHFVFRTCWFKIRVQMIWTRTMRGMCTVKLRQVKIVKWVSCVVSSERRNSCDSRCVTFSWLSCSVALILQSHWVITRATWVIALLWHSCGLCQKSTNRRCVFSGALLAPQSGALRISAYRDFQSNPIPYPIHL